MNKTADCTKIWNLIMRVDGYDSKLCQDLADAFTDFECQWSEHATEYHTDKPKTDS